MASYEHLRVSASDLREALEGGMGEALWLLDLESGQVIVAGLDGMDEETDGEPDEEAWEDPNLFMPIRPMESHESFQIMEDFVDELPEGEGCRALARALRLPRPFRSFKDTLADFPDFRERWFKFHHGRMLEAAQEWLLENVPGAQLAVD